MNQTKSNSPIFIHSLYRSGSTYLFNVFRRSKEGYWCYQEPENEGLVGLDEHADELLKVGKATSIELRHPPLNKSYFFEFYQIRKKIKGLFRASFTFDDYFVDEKVGLPEDQSRYYGALINHAKGRPVIQSCLSAGKVGALKKAFGGVHVHLWREPRNQWWSFKINLFFDPSILRIFNAPNPPAVLADVAHHCGIRKFRLKDNSLSLEFFRKHPLNTADNYFAFYSLWLFAFLEYDKYADMTINIDSLSVDRKYREAILGDLSQLGIGGVGFSDCALPRMMFSKKEQQFFQEIEHKVHGMFLLHGYRRSKINAAIAKHQKALKLQQGGSHDVANDATRAREIALNYLDQYTQTRNSLTDREQEVSELQQQVLDLQSKRGQEFSELEQQVLDLQSQRQQTEQQRLLHRKQIEETRAYALSMTEKLVDQLHFRNREWVERIQQGLIPIGQPDVVSDSDKSLKASLIRAAKCWKPGRRIDA